MTQEQFNSVKLVDARRIGNSTRIVDALVQQLFTTGSCEYWDHTDRLGNSALEHTLRILEDRLSREHSLNRNVGYRINKKGQTITLINTRNENS